MAKLKIGYVPQSVNIEKNTPVSVYDLIASYQYNYPVFLPKSKKIEAKIRETLEVFEAEELINKQVCNLSGGQLQRVLLSMAIMDEPNLLLLDEPVSGIDQNGMELFYKTMDYLKTHYDLAIILISHDLDYVAKYADHVVLLDKTVAKQGTVKEVFESKEFERIFYTGEESWAHHHTAFWHNGNHDCKQKDGILFRCTRTFSTYRNRCRSGMRHGRHLACHGDICDSVCTSFK